ncbi:MAG: hypothetical protein ABI415_09005 [Flavitalea sp.]
MRERIILTLLIFLTYANGYSQSPASGDISQISSTINAPNNFENEISAIRATAATTPGGWTDLLSIGGAADGSFNGGTDNSNAVNSWIATASDNSVLYIPPGSYKFNSTINWAGVKKLFLISYGNLYFGLNSGFIIDGTEQKLVFNGRLMGTNQDKMVNYTGQTNSGIWLRNGNNNEVYLNEVYGFKYAVRLGGYEMGQGVMKGTQYCKVYWNWLRRNSVGVYLSSDSKAGSRGCWCNENFFWGGEISGDTGIVFRKNSEQGDRFNGNKFYNIGFEYSGNQVPMRLAIWAEYANNNQFFGGRIEARGVKEAFHFASNCDNFQFIGWYWNLSYFANPGNNILVTGSIYEDITGVCVGNIAQGYGFSPNNYFNQRVRVWGTKRSPSIAKNLDKYPNMDIIWAVATDEKFNSPSASVGRGINFVEYNSPSNATLTLRPSAETINQTITVANTGKGTVLVTSENMGGQVSIAPGQSKQFYCTATKHIPI